MPKVLSEADVARAGRDGCVFPVRVLPPAEAARYRSLYEDVEARLGKDGVPEILSLKPHLLFRWLFELGTTPALLDAVEDLIGPDILITTSSIWAKHARDPRFVTWHQDSAYFGYDPVEVWGAWIALTDSRVDNGCLRYLPGSHENPEMAHEETWDERNMLSRGQRITDVFNETRAVDVELAPGECTLHHFRLAHSSEPNRSDRRRIGILFVYCPPRVRPTLSLDAAALVRGADRHGHWRREAPPERDLDPGTVRYYRDVVSAYADPETRSEAERGAAD